MSRLKSLCSIFCLFALIGCGAPVPQIQTSAALIERDPASQEGCRLVKSQEADVYKSFYKEKALDEVWYDLDYARTRLDEHKNSGDCSGASSP